jgi:hypothetical protein
MARKHRARKMITALFSCCMGKRSPVLFANEQPDSKLCTKEPDSKPYAKEPGPELYANARDSELYVEERDPESYVEESDSESDAETEWNAAEPNPNPFRAMTLRKKPDPPTAMTFGGPTRETIEANLSLGLCTNCAKIDLDDGFANPNVPQDKYNLGLIRELNIDSCSLCKLLATLPFDGVYKDEYLVLSWDTGFFGGEIYRRLACKRYYEIGGGNLCVDPHWLISQRSTYGTMRTSGQTQLTSTSFEAG